MQTIIKLLDWLMSGQQEEEVSLNCFIQRVISFLLRLFAIGFIYWIVSDAVGDTRAIIGLIIPSFIMTMR